jgi:hypothetical protein
MNWTVEEVNNYFRDNDSACEIERIEEDGKVRFDISWCDTFGYVAEEEKSYPQSSFYMNESQQEEGALRQIFVCYQIPVFHIASAIEELAKHDPRTAQSHAILALYLLFSFYRKETVLAKFGLRETSPEYFELIPDWTAPKEVFINGDGLWCECRFNGYHADEDGKWKCASCGKLHGPFEHFGHTISESRQAGAR